MIEVKVKNIGLDSITGSPIVMLVDVNNEEDIYPIWIGVAEAEGIILQKSDVKTPRPLTYDLLKNIIVQLGGNVKHISITDMKDNAYIAEIVVEQNGKEIVIDSRPSDAINIALRFNVPIYLNEEVVNKVSVNEIKEADVNKGETAQAEESYEAEVAEPEAYPEVKNVEDLETPELEKEPEVDPELEKFREFIENIKPEDFMVDKKEKTKAKKTKKKNNKKED